MTAPLLAVGYQDNWWPILISPFMRDALLGGTIVALAAGLLGYFIVVRNTAFAAHAVAHIGLPGATGAVLLGVPTGLGLGVFCVGGAIIIGALGKRVDDRDVATGTILAMAIALGLFFSSLATKNASTMTNVLFGNLLAISHGQLIAFAGLLILLGLCVGVILWPTTLRFGQSTSRPGQRCSGAVLIDHLHGAARARGDDGGSGRRNLATFCSTRDAGRDRHQAGGQALNRDVHLDDHQRCLSLGGAWAVGHVQHAAELCHRDYRLHGLVRCATDKPPYSAADFAKSCG